MGIVNEADEVTERVLKHKSVIPLLLLMGVVMWYAIMFFHNSDGGHSALAQASDLQEIRDKQKDLVTKKELDQKLRPITRSLNSISAQQEQISCQIAETDLRGARKDILFYKLKDNPNETDRRNLELLKTEVDDLEKIRDRLCQ